MSFRNRSLYLRRILLNNFADIQLLKNCIVEDESGGEHARNMRNVKKLSEQELQRLPKSSWHDEYKSSAWIFVGGLPYDLSEGDVMSIFSQYGEITNLNLVRDKDTGKQKGFCFVCYEDQRSTILAVDNFNGTRVLGRILRIDHVKDYKPPRNSEPTNKIKTKKYKKQKKVINSSFQGL
ncbi:RNA-binding motif protein, X-linked 2-like isoform X2 [Aphis gossypii]|uniref:RNA-binding motif protein, X-linked 2-like isoform X2 n=1 Tax=Aphis gossypii TaxID=80765 RepID=UPI002159A5DA|nr:RNA-binding motif protein, X-linked 2-like isoform X2 [Aphis gossypii]